MKLLTTLLTLLLINSALANIDCPNSPRKSRIATLMTEAQYVNILKRFKSENLRVIDVEIMIKNGKRIYSIVGRENRENIRWAMHTKLRSSEFHTKWQNYKQKGYRLIDQESYRISGTQFYAGIWIKQNIPWASNRNLSYEQLNAKINNYKAQNMMLIDIEAYKVGSSLKYSIIMVKNVKNIPWTLTKHTVHELYSDIYIEKRKQGYRLIDKELYRASNKDLFAAIWVKDGKEGMAASSRGQKNFNNNYLYLKDSGYRVENIETFIEDGIQKLSLIAVENLKERVKWKDSIMVGYAISQYAAANKIAGFSVAIAKQGKIVYLRGFGYSNIAAKKVAFGNTIYPLGSISKSITGLLSLKLDDLNKINLDEEVYNYIETLPADHT